MQRCLTQCSRLLVAPCARRSPPPRPAAKRATTEPPAPKRCRTMGAAASSEGADAVTAPAAAPAVEIKPQLLSVAPM